MIVLTTEHNMRLMFEADILFVDGTFKSVPRLFCQVFTLHSIFWGHFMTHVVCYEASRDKYTITFLTFSKIKLPDLT